MLCIYIYYILQSHGPFGYEVMTSVPEDDISSLRTWVPKSILLMIEVLHDATCITYYTYHPMILSGFGISGHAGLLSSTVTWLLSPMCLDPLRVSPQNTHTEMSSLPARSNIAGPLSSLAMAQGALQAQTPLSEGFAEAGMTLVIS